MMTPFEKAREVYRREPCARTFEEDLILHLRFGYVIATPEVFLMFRPVSKQWPAACVVNPANVLHTDPDCWHVTLAAGNPRLFHGCFPYPLEWVSGERQNQLRFYRFQKIAGKLLQ
jgi:hypothetical protein